jgi:hypothetical protein
MTLPQVGLERDLAEIGLVEVAVADRAIGGHHDALDADAVCLAVGERGRIAGRGVARGDERSSHQGRGHV